MLKKGAFFTDIHWGKKSDSGEHNDDCMHFIDWFCSQVKLDPTIDHIQFLGDWHEQRSSINVSTLVYSYEGAKKLNELGLPVFFASGNHDHYYRNTSDVFSTYHFNSFENFRVYNKITVIEDIYGKVLFVPYICEDEYPILLQYKDIPVVCGHLELKGFRVSGANNTLEHGPEAVTYFKNKKRIFSGHFHARQTKDNVHYIGNTFPMDFSDANDFERGMATYNFEQDKLEYINWPDCPKYIRASLSEVLKSPKKILKSNARVKVYVDDDITLSETNELRQTLSDTYNLREIVLEEKNETVIEMTDIEKEIEDLELEGINQIIPELLKRIKNDKIDNEKLVELYRKL